MLWRYLYIVKSWASVPLPSLYFPARVICGGGELQFYPTAAILLEIEKYSRLREGKMFSRKQAGSSAGNKLDPQLETGKVSSHGQVRKIS